MYGAIIGDIIGSAYEWERTKDTNFPIVTPDSKVTDDTVMTVATADALLNNKSFGETYQEWGYKYPKAGYGGLFRKWLRSKNTKPYGSFGNGSAMRVSPCAYRYSTLEEVLNCAKESSICTHDHPEGIKGAQATAAAIFMASKGKSKDEIKEYIETEFGYNLSRKLDDIRVNYKFDSTCQGSVPESIIAFLESDSFEHTIRLAVSMGGDADTMAAIAGSIAEAFYGLDEELLAKVKHKIPYDISTIIDKFYSTYVV